MGSGNLSAVLCPSVTLEAEIQADGALSGALTIAGSIPSYAGQSTITPSSEEQTIACAGLLMPADITIEPVPAGYGKISWNGITLTVS